MAFDLKAVEAAIADTQFVGKLIHLPTAGSTNTLALDAAQAGAQSGVWIADEQTAGRGRGGHGWYSQPGDGLYVSVLVTPSLPIALALLISLATGLAAKRAIFENTELEVDIRWPNDLLLNGKKCGGILVETAVSSADTGAEAMLRYAVIGIGINLNHQSFPPELISLATSLRLEGGKSVSREGILVSLLCILDSEIRQLGDGDGTVYAEELLRRFTEASSWVWGKRVRVDEGGGYTGLTAGLNNSGFLLVDSDDGTKRIVLSGGVREQ
jgi:BirA family biotin operon repressor/biotin-[acetyl-CoA-carboxylase] ligase